MKKPGWNPKKGIVEPKPRLKVANSLDFRSDAAATQTPAQAQAQAQAPSQTAMPTPDPALTETSGVSNVNSIDNSMSPGADNNEDEQEHIDLTVPRVYKRPEWKNVLHWTAFLCCVVFDVSVIFVSIRHHLYTSHAPTMVMLGKELLSYAMTVGLNLLILPSIVFEARSVELREDCLIVRHLVKTSRIPWSDVKSLFDPLLLKFAIIRTPKFFQLINKRDIRNYDELLHTIKVKAGLPSQ